MTDRPTDPARTLRRRRTVGLVAIVVAIVGLTGVVAVLRFGASSEPPPLSDRVRPLLPDLGIAPLGERVAGAEVDGREYVRFSVTFVNMGDGDFILAAGRPHILSDDWVVEQRVLEDGGGYTVTPTEATLTYGGDGHEHWHVREVERHAVEKLDGEVVGEVTKQGFCFYDTDPFRLDLPRAPTEPVYSATACGGRVDGSSRMGLSVGWGDEYPWNMLEQRIDLTDAPDGRYRLRAIADPFGWFDELDESNNETWVEFELSRDTEGLPHILIVASAED
jgi:hypothetical protein